MFSVMIQDGKSIRIMRKPFNITAGIQLRHTHMKLTIKKIDTDSFNIQIVSRVLFCHVSEKEV